MSGSAGLAASSSALYSVADGAKHGGLHPVGPTAQGSRKRLHRKRLRIERFFRRASYRASDLGDCPLYGVIPWPCWVYWLHAWRYGSAMESRTQSLAQAELLNAVSRNARLRTFIDYVSNDLAYLILRFDKTSPMARPPSEEDYELGRSVAMGASHASGH